jgi:cystathionine beta-lyase
VPVDPAPLRTATRWDEQGPCVRFHVGLEDPEDLIADLAHGFASMRSLAAGER